jgi:hypothetical protein
MLTDARSRQCSSRWRAVVARWLASADALIVAQLLALGLGGCERGFGARGDRMALVPARMWIEADDNGDRCRQS